MKLTSTSPQSCGVCLQAHNDKRQEPCESLTVVQCLLGVSQPTPPTPPSGPPELTLEEKTQDRGGHPFSWKATGYAGFLKQSESDSNSL